MGKSRKNSGLRQIVPAILALAMITAGASGETRTWTGLSGQNWFTPNNWNPLGPPASADDLRVYAGTPDASGKVEVDGGGGILVNAGGTVLASLTIHDWLTVGHVGAGTLALTEGGEVSNTYGYLGYGAGSSGTATVDGPGSTWTNSSDLYVGRDGTGTLNIEGGGEASSQSGYLGYSSGSQGTAAVTGSGARWTNSYGLYAGYYGDGTLNIEAGAQVSSSYGRLGSLSESWGTATVTGSGSRWTNSGDLYVGDHGTGTLRIEARGRVSSSSGCLGYSSGSGTATVTGSGSKWTNSYDLTVGHGGVGTLRIEAGGQVSSSWGCLGDWSGSQGTATVTGTGSKWTNSGYLYVGYEGTGTLSIEAGGQVSVGGTLTVGARGTVALAGGTLDALKMKDASGGSTAFSAGMLRFGTYQGSLANPGCTVRSRDGANGMAVTGDYSQGAAGSLLIEIGGPELADYDQLEVTGQASLGGFLDLVQLSSYVPSYGQSFRIVKAGSTSGVFAGTPGYQFAPSVWMAVLYDADGVRAVAARPGDTNCDGTVNVGDLGILAGNWGQSPRTWAQGNFTTPDTIVDVGDLGVLAGNWGWTGTPAPGAPVPEPASLALIGMGTLALLRRRR
jgi:T5SS/PEP-CTERM-associated repeat protein